MSNNIGDLHLIQEINIFQKFFSEQNLSGFMSNKTNIFDMNHKNFHLACTVAKIIDNGINGVLPNWLALKNELNVNHFKKKKANNHPLSNVLCFSPQLIFYIIVRHKKTKLETFEKYQLVFIPGFDNYVVTLYLSNPENRLTEHFAIGKADCYMAPKNAAKKIIFDFNESCYRGGRIREKLMTLESDIVDFEEMDEFFI